MALEDLTGTKYIDSLVATNPVGATDPKSEGDDHIRGIKNTLLTSFPNITGAVTATHTELNALDGITSSVSELNILTGVTSTAAELNIMDAGATVTTPTVASGDAFVMDDLDVGMAQVDIDNVDTYLAQTTKTLTNKSISGDQIDSGTLPADRIGAASLVAAKIDFTLATGGSWSIATNSQQVIPAGLYMCVRTAGTGAIAVEVNQGASWRAHTSVFGGGLLMSDGTNVRLNNPPSDTSTVYYRQLA